MVSARVVADDPAPAARLSFLHVAVRRWICLICPGVFLTFLGFATSVIPHDGLTRRVSMLACPAVPTMASSADEYASGTVFTEAKSRHLV